MIVPAGPVVTGEPAVVLGTTAIAQPDGKTMSRTVSRTQHF